MPRISKAGMRDPSGAPRRLPFQGRLWGLPDAYIFGIFPNGILNLPRLLPPIMVFIMERA